MTEAERESLAQHALARAGAASVLSTFFWVPIPPERIQDWQAGDTLSYFAEYCALLGCEGSEIVREIQEAFGSANVSDAERQLNIDSTYLFRIGRDDVPASPYGSVWLEPERLLMGTTTREVAVVFREYGVMPAQDTDDFVPDHISRELEFLAHVWRNQSTSLSEGDATAAAEHGDLAMEFFERYCAPWWGRFADAVVEHAETPFFRQAGRVLGEFALTLASPMGSAVGGEDRGAES